MYEAIKNAIKRLFSRQRNDVNNYIQIMDTTTFDSDYQKSEIWYRGDAAEIDQFFAAYQTNLIDNKFWGSSSVGHAKPRKIHTGLASVIIDKLVDIVVDDMGDIEIWNGVDQTTKKPIKDIEATKRWAEIEEANDFRGRLLKELVRDSLFGDATAKIGYDSDFAKAPLFIESVKGNQVLFERKRGRLAAITFMIPKIINKKNYVLSERYDFKGVSYTVYDDQGKDVTNPMIEGFGSDLTSFEFKFDNDKIMAMPLIIYPSEKYKGRGKSILANKDGAFDALDESFSQWIDALRAGRTKTYIPKDLVARDPNNGTLIAPSGFDTSFIEVGRSKEQGASVRIEVETPIIQAEQYNQTYITNLDLALQGLISPSTIGIDVKKLDNAEAQREKEKTTLYTRNKIIRALEIFIPQLVERCLQFDDVMKDQKNGTTSNKYEVTVSFGEYANPSFEAQIETIGLASDKQIMSVEMMVSQLWGDSLTEEERDAEIQRIKEERGMITQQEPSMAADGVLGEFDEFEDEDTPEDEDGENEGENPLFDRVEDGDNPEDEEEEV